MMRQRIAEKKNYSILYTICTRLPLRRNMILDAKKKKNYRYKKKNKYRNLFQQTIDAHNQNILCQRGYLIIFRIVCNFFVHNFFFSPVLHSSFGIHHFIFYFIFLLYFGYAPPFNESVMIRICLFCFRLFFQQ